MTKNMSKAIEAEEGPSPSFFAVFATRFKTLDLVPCRKMGPPSAFYLLRSQWGSQAIDRQPLRNMHSATSPVSLEGSLSLMLTKPRCLAIRKAASASIPVTAQNAGPLICRRRNTARAVE